MLPHSLFRIIDIQIITAILQLNQGLQITYVPTICPITDLGVCRIFTYLVSSWRGYGNTNTVSDEAYKLLKKASSWRKLLQVCTEKFEEE